MTLLKICGMTDPSLIYLAAKRGVSMLGFILEPTSPRYCPPELACEYIEWLRRDYPLSKSVVVLVSDDPDRVRQVHETLAPDFIQLHTAMSSELFNALQLPNLIKVFSVRGPMIASDIVAYNAAYYLFDTYKQGQQGGTGQSFNWNWIPVSLWPRSIIAGGLTPDDIARLVFTYHPFAIDLNSKLEIRHGQKSPARLERAIRKWHAATNR